MSALARDSGAAAKGFERVRASLLSANVYLLLGAGGGGKSRTENFQSLAVGFEKVSLWTTTLLGMPFSPDKAAYLSTLRLGTSGKLARDAGRRKKLEYKYADRNALFEVQES